MRIPRTSPGVRAWHRRAVAIGVPTAAAALVLAGAPALAAEPVAELSLAAPASAEIGDVIRVSVAAAAASELFALDVDLAYDPAALEPVDGGDEYLDGGFGAAAFGDGAADIAYTRLGTSPGVSGDAELAAVSFEVVAAGETTVSVSGGSLIGAQGESVRLSGIAPIAVDVAPGDGADGGSGGDADDSGSVDGVDGPAGDDGTDAPADGDGAGVDPQGGAGDGDSRDADAEGELAVTGGTIAGAGALVALAVGAVAVGTALLRRRKERA